MVLIAPHDSFSISGEDRRPEAVTYNYGAGVCYNERGEALFLPGQRLGKVLGDQETLWRVTEDRLAGSTGRLSPRLPGNLVH